MISLRTARLALLPILLLAALLSVLVGSAAAAAPQWRFDALSNTSAAQGSTLDYLLQLNNLGDAASSGAFTIEGHLPSEITATALISQNFPAHPLQQIVGPFTCAGDGPGNQLAGASNFSCTFSAPIEAHGSVDEYSHQHFVLLLSTTVGAGAAAQSTARFEVSGGGAASYSIEDLVRVQAEPPPFGFQAFDADLAADRAGHPISAAAAHPYEDATSFTLNTFANPEPIKADLWPVQPAKDVIADLPPGLVGSTAGVAQCTSTQLANTEGVESKPLCSPASQVGTVDLRENGLIIFPDVFSPIPVFNMVPRPGAPAEFGFNFLGVVVTLTAHVRSAGDYGLAVDSSDIPQGIAIAGTTFHFWGVPADDAHNAERACPGELEPWEEGPTCPAGTPSRAFLRAPTACGGLLSTVHADSWTDPGSYDANGEPQTEDAAWAAASSLSHQLPGYPSPQQGPPAGIEECESVPFEPTLSARPTTDKADSPSGLELDLGVPQDCWSENQEDSICQSDLEKAEVALPQGVSLNPASADGLSACSAAQIGLSTTEGATPIHLDTANPSCPQSSRIGSVEIESPLIEEHLTGAVYLAAQGDNPFKSLLAFYIVARANGVILKFPAHVAIDPGSGQLRTVVDELPQLPFSAMHLELKSGSRAPLLTPPACGTYETQATLTPYSHQGTEGEEGTPIAQLSSSFEIRKGPAGAPCPAHPAAFAPKLEAGTQNPLAGAYSPFNLKLTREDGSQRLAGLSLTLPPGMIGKLAGVSYCPDSALGSLPGNEGTAAVQLTSPSCPASSLLGTVTVGAGAGATPFYLQTGRAYLAGPYKGAPLSLAIITPALAGPFDLGNVLVRTALRIDPASTQITAVSDPLPQILDGIPLDLRDIRVNLNRPGFTLNPTSCDEMSVGGSATGTEGATAPLSERFQVGNCENLPFKPKLSFRLKGPVRRTANPALIANLTAKPGEANIARAQVKLPPAAFLDNSHIGQICTRVQFASGHKLGEGCPSGSVYGTARAVTPLLEAPLEGNVYLRSSSHQLPDLVAALGGQIEVALEGRTDSVKSALRNTFEAVPDAPVSSFHLQLFGGRKGLIEMSSGFCKHSRATVKLDGQNGKTHDTEPVVAAKACGKHKLHHRR